MIGKWHDIQLQKFAEGRTSPADIGVDALGIVADASDNVPKSTVQLSRLGCKAKHVGNMLRDLTRHIRRALPLNLDPFCISVPHVLEDKAGVEYKPTYVMLPHEVVGAMWAGDRDTFYDVLVGGQCVSNLVEFWDGMRHSEWWASLLPAVKEELALSPHTYIPLRAHGDDVPITKHSSTLVFNVSSPLSCHLPAKLSKLLLMSVCLNGITDMGLQKMYDVCVFLRGNARRQLPSV